MKEYIRVPNLSKWQHYKNRCPPWIKLHRDLLNSYRFSELPDASKAHVLSIWLLASQMDNRLPNDSKWLARRINATEHVDIKLLSSAGLLEVFSDDSTLLARRKQSASRETEAEVETTPSQEKKISITYPNGIEEEFTHPEPPPDSWVDPLTGEEIIEP